MTKDQIIVCFKGLEAGTGLFMLYYIRIIAINLVKKFKGEKHEIRNI